MDTAYYQAMHSFVPDLHNSNALPVKRGDILLVSVQRVSGCPKGWLYAFHQTKHIKGYVPVEVLKYIGSEISHLQSAEQVGTTSETELHNASHQFTIIYISNPIQCVHCKDYLWDIGKIAIQCSGTDILPFFFRIIITLYYYLLRISPFSNHAPRFIKMLSGHCS